MFSVSDFSDCPPLKPEEEDQLEDGAHFPAFGDELPGWFSTKNEDGISVLASV